MMRTLLYSLAALLALTARAAYAGDCDGGCGGCASGHCNKHCSCITGEYCPDCSCPCDHCHLPSLCGDAHAQKLADELLHGHDCCARKHAAHKLGCCLHVDFCKSPEAVSALIQALFCDTCWEVRREAALALGFQFWHTPEAVAALYIASRLDHHVMVRDGAAMALDMVTTCRYGCFKDVYTAADKIIPRIRKNYDPTHCKCVPELVAFCGNIGAAPAVMSSSPAEIKGEKIPAPKEEEKGEKVPAPKEEKKDDGK
jgi:HEAT repeats